MPVAYPLFLAICIIFAVKLMIDEQGFDFYNPYSKEAYLNAQKKLHERFIKREELRKDKKQKEDMLDKKNKKK